MSFEKKPFTHLYTLYMRHSEIVKFIYHFYCTWNTFFFFSSLVLLFLWFIVALFDAASFLDWLHLRFNDLTGMRNSLIANKLVHSALGECVYQPICDTNVYIVQLPLNWCLLNGREQGFFRRLYFSLFSLLLICLQNIIHIGFFFIRLLHHIRSFVPSIHFCLAIRVSSHYFGDFNIWMFSKSASNHTSILDVGMLLLCHLFPFPPILLIHSIRCNRRFLLVHNHTKKQSCCKIYFV